MDKAHSIFRAGAYEKPCFFKLSDSWWLFLKASNCSSRIRSDTADPKPETITLVPQSSCPKLMVAEATASVDGSLARRQACGRGWRVGLGSPAPASGIEKSSQCSMIMTRGNSHFWKVREFMITRRLAGS